jgi:recombination protein RecT
MTNQNHVQTYGQRIASFKDLLEKAAPKLAEILPAHISPERMCKVALIAANQNPQLLECTPASIVSAMMTAASLGLEPDGTMGSAYLVPYRTRCQLIIGYRGLIDLARRSGHISKIEAHAVYEGDEFAYEHGLNPDLTHRPTLGERGEIVAFYALAILSDGASQFVVLSKADVDKVRGGSAAGGGGPWSSHYSEMGKKTAARNLCKYLPFSATLNKAMSLDVCAESGQITQAEFDIIDDDDAPEDVQAAPKSKSSAIAAKLGAKKKAPEPQDDDAAMLADLGDPVAGAAMIDEEGIPF